MRVPADFELTAIERRNGLRAGCFAIRGAGGAALLEEIQSVTKHATVSLDGNLLVLRYRTCMRSQNKVRGDRSFQD